MEAARNDKVLKNNEAFKSVKLSHDAKLAKIEMESKLAAATVSGNIKDIKSFEVKLSMATKIALKAEERATRKLAEAEVASVRANRKLAEEELALKRVNDANKVRDVKAGNAKLAEEKLAVAWRLAMSRERLGKQD